MSTTTLKPSPHSAHHNGELKPEEIHTIAYISLTLIFVLVIGLISAIYMKYLKDRRNNQAAIRGILDIMAGNDTNSVSSVNERNDDIVPTESIHIPPETLLQDRIQLPPLAETEVHLPAPHLSAPVLPPIRANRRRQPGVDIRYSIPRPRGQEDICSPSIADISRSLARMSRFVGNKRPDSAASFPDEQSGNRKTEEPPPKYEEVVIKCQDEKLPK